MSQLIMSMQLGRWSVTDLRNGLLDAVPFLEWPCRLLVTASGPGNHGQPLNAQRFRWMRGRGGRYQVETVLSSIRRTTAVAGRVLRRPRKDLHGMHLVKEISSCRCAGVGMRY